MPPLARARAEKSPDNAAPKAAHPGAGRAVKRVAIIAPNAATLLPLRGPLLETLLARKHSILCLAPDFTDEMLEHLKAEGIDGRRYPLAAKRLAITSEIATLRSLAASLKDWRPDVVLAYGAMPAILGSLAAKQAKTAHVTAMFTGLDGVIQQETGETRRGKAVETTISRSMRVNRWRALRAADSLILHNESDRQRLDSLGLLPQKLSVHVVPGSGVDLNHFSWQPLLPLDDGLNFIMIGQLCRAKGILDFCEAARRVQAAAPTANFLVVGPPDASDGGLTDQDLAPFRDVVEFAGAVQDVRPFLNAAHVFVLPSRFGEGLSKTLMEALATGRPLITSDIPGCLEMVDERVNGCLVAPGDVDALAEAMASFLRRPDLIPSMARASRAKAERWFNVERVNRQMLDILDIE